jgi:hypothetical protein
MKQKERLARRALAYKRTFCGDRTTPHLDADIVLADLQKFARINEGAIVRDGHGRADPIQMAYRDGCVDVFRRIMLHLGLNETHPFKTEEPDNESAQS